MRKKKQLKWWQGLIILGIIWLAGAICDRIWFALDNSVPAWDQADYLNGSLNYWHALQNPQWFNGEWWRSFWLLSNKIPPLNYILTVPFLNLFGTSQDAATLVMLLYSAILLISVYGLGVALFNISVGLWAASLCQLLPGLYYYRLEFLLDYPLTAIVTFSFWLLTVWKINEESRKEIRVQKQNLAINVFKSWLLAIGFGISFGLALFIKQTALFFLLTPLIWLFFTILKNRQWLRLIQLFTSLIIGILICFPWYRTNWLLILTSSKRATVDSAIAEGDPALNTIGAWTYYGEVLPYLLSWCLLIIPLVGLLLYGIPQWYRQRKKRLVLKKLFTPSALQPLNFSPWRWLSVFLIGGYLLSSLNINKDARYILPLLPVFSLILAVGLLSWGGRWQNYLRWTTVILAGLLLLGNIFPLGGNLITAKLSPLMQHYPYTDKKYPHPEVIQEIITTSPYLRSILGVLPSTPEINQHNFSFYGGQYNFQVVGRQVGVREEEVEQDARSLDWFITKTGDQGSIPEAQAKIVNLVEEGGDFELQKTWQLRDRSKLKLYYRLQPLVEVKPIDLPSQPLTQISQPGEVKLESVIVPQKAPPGIPIPITYRWSGNWSQLESGIVLLTWQSLCTDRDLQQCPTDKYSNAPSQWLHDHGIAMGALDNSLLYPYENNKFFQVTEHTAMLPPETIAPGKYKLTGTYLDRNTGKTYPLQLPTVTITIDPKAKAKPAPELDLVTQLRTIAPKMAYGIAELEPIFAQTARINQYDAQQDYLKQAELALSYRLQQNNLSQQQRSDWSYTVALSQVLQQDVEGAIASWQQIIQLDPENIYSYAYLAFVYLYDWHPQLAEQALNSALAINPNVPEIQTLSGIAALMQGNLIKAWQLLQPMLVRTH